MINGKLNSLSKDLGLKGTQYNTCVSILFVGYVIITQKTRPCGIFADIRKLSIRTSPLEHDSQSSTTVMVHVWSVYVMESCNRDHVANSTIGFMLAWSVVSLLTYMAHNYHGMLVCRFILGITEAPVRQSRSKRL